MNRMREFCRENKRVLWVLVIVLYTGFIYHNSLTPAVESARQSGRVLALVRGVIGAVGLDNSWVTEHIVRKTAHFAEYSLLGLLLWNCLCSFRPARSLWLTVQAWLTILIPLVDETLQLFTEGRSGQVDDVWLDVAGVCFGTLCMVALKRLWRMLRRGGKMAPPRSAERGE